MTTSYGALCTDFVFETNLAVKMPLPNARDTVMHFFERIKKTIPAMDRFRKIKNELILETARHYDDETGEPTEEGMGFDTPYRYLSLRERMLRCSVVNPGQIEDALKQHDLILKTAPDYLGISPLDIDSFEMTFVFEMDATGDHDEIVKNALFDGSPIGEALSGMRVIELQPLWSFALSRDGRIQASISVETRRKSRRGSTSRYANEPLRIVLSLRRLAPFHDLEDLAKTLPALFKTAEQLAHERVIPHIITPIAHQIAASNG